MDLPQPLEGKQPCRGKKIIIMEIGLLGRKLGKEGYGVEDHGNKMTKSTEKGKH